eukprot:TRINITY_DN2600_c1_g1_i3.p1 TRINITY_DN2600_c1_g1~~TRINITY_DN2600_c1_g1_i3.p1  ORF type:complete len:188 (+),score=48.37 TRINITY_DN2600_c1_g1_i3:72-635(+)
MYVQYGGGGLAQPGMYQQVGSAQAYMPQMQAPSMPQHMPQQFGQRPTYGQPPAGMLQAPRDPNAVAGSSYGMPAYGQGSGYNMPPVRQQQAGQAPDFSAASAAGVAGIGPQGPAGMPQFSSPGGAQAQQPGQLPAALTQPALGGDPDDEDPNRLPTFVKVRGLPAEHDPRIARKPKPKKRAPGICCA